MKNLKKFEDFNSESAFRSLSFPTEKINNFLNKWEQNNIDIKNTFEKGRVTYVEFYTTDDFKKAAILAQEIV